MKLPDIKNLSFTEFPATDSHTWKAQILKDIRVATAEERQAVYEDKMRWQSYEGITIEPFYTKEDLQKLPAVNKPILQESWQNRQYIQVINEKEANGKALEAMAAGADALLLDISTDTTVINLFQLLQNIKLSATPVSFRLQHFPVDFLAQLQQIAPYQWKGGLYYDPLTQYTSRIDTDPGTLFEPLAQAINVTKDYSHFRALTVGSHHFHEAGASAVQELAFLLNTFVEYAHRLTDMGVAIEDVFSSTELSLSVSTSYFVEIAKLRALQFLWQQLANAYQVQPVPAYIHTRTAQWNKLAADAYNNMIRATIEAMAASLGGAASISVLPYNHDVDDTFAIRIARNVSVILKEESYLDKVLDVASGSYYIEHLTHSLAAEAWQLFQSIEARGGYLQALQAGLISEQIANVRKLKEADLQSGKQVLVGVNKYAPSNSILAEPGFSGFKDW